jgi:CheY-like chemotaxis protein
MSHELRTPLNAILGFGQLLEVDLTAPEDVESIQQVLKAGHHLLELINEVLDIAKIESGRVALSLEAIDAVQLMRDTIVMVRPLAAAREIRISMTDSDQIVNADRQRLMQVFLNLLSNAIKYNRKGGSVEIDFLPEGDNSLRITITDSGLGIAAEDLGSVFNPFERLQAAETDVEGTGLGLVVCKRLVELMGGEITAESQLGKGSTFSIKLSLASKGARPTDLRNIEPGWQGTAPGTSFTVLYIEDNDSNARLLQRILESRLGVNFLTAKRGLHGLELAREHQPDVILLDLYLPDISGEEVLLQLRKDEATAGIPVLVITADATSGHAERLLAAGAQSYLTKPLEMSKLFKAIEEALQRPATSPVAAD